MHYEYFIHLITTRKSRVSCVFHSGIRRNHLICLQIHLSYFSPLRSPFISQFSFALWVSRLRKWLIIFYTVDNCVRLSVNGCSPQNTCRLVNLNGCLWQNRFLRVPRKVGGSSSSSSSNIGN